MPVIRGIIVQGHGIIAQGHGIIAQERDLSYRQLHISVDGNILSSKFFLTVRILFNAFVGRWNVCL